MKLVGLHSTEASHMGDYYLLDEDFFEIPSKTSRNSDIFICLDARYPELAKEIAKENYTGLQLFCKLQGLKLIDKIFIP